MTLLLDTHTLIWFLESDDRLSDNALKAMRQPDAQLVLSIVSLWEMTIKVSLGKLSLTQSIEFVINQITALDFKLLNIHPDDLLTLAALPFHHGDPFDRLLVAQSVRLNYTVVSRDKAFDLYQVNRLW